MAEYILRSNYLNLGNQLVKKYQNEHPCIAKISIIIIFALIITLKIDNYLQGAFIFTPYRYLLGKL